MINRIRMGVADVSLGIEPILNLDGLVLQAIEAGGEKIRRSNFTMGCVERFCAGVNPRRPILQDGQNAWGGKISLGEQQQICDPDLFFKAVNTRDKDFTRIGSVEQP